MGIEGRIAEVLRRHRVGPGQWCRCAAAPGYLTHSEHVAAVLVAELGLTEEHRTLADGEGGISTNWKTGKTTSHMRPCTCQVRYVTSWETQQ